MSRFAFVFPGQGSQTVGMISEMIQNHQLIKDIFNQASTILDFDLTELVTSGPAELLNRTDNTQPALLTTSVALYKLWQQQSEIQPDFMAGHSLGEYSALVCAGALNFSDALKLVKQRGEFMMQAVPEGTGAMAAILGLDNHLVEQACCEAAGEQVVSAVNYNSPGQLVIAGNIEAVERAMVLCKEAGAKRALPLPVSVPSHCALMIPAAEKLSEVLATINIAQPVIPVINNVDVAIETTENKIADALVRQLYHPVRWTESVEFMAKNDISTLIECGPGKVLTGLSKRIDRSILALVTTDQANFNKSLEALN